jgi:hypothetical protein
VGALGVIFAVFTLGYILGVWTSAMVFRQRQRGYEDAVPVKVIPQDGPWR